MSLRIFEACNVVSISSNADFRIGDKTADVTDLESTSIVTSNRRPPTFERSTLQSSVMIICQNYILKRISYLSYEPGRQRV